MRALVTGGAGFIGSNIVDALVARGDEVAVLDDLSSGKEVNLREALGSGATLHVGDIRDAARVRSVVDEVRPEVVFHLAAQMDVRRSVADPAFDALTNVVGTINVLEAAREAGARRFVNTSTGGAIYGETDLVPTPETVKPNPMAPYGQSKFCAEEYLGWARRLYGFETVTLRYGNVYGPRQDGSGDAGVIAIFLDRVLKGERPTVFGDGRQTRDYIFVADVVEANLVAAEHPDASGSFNVGTSEESSVLDLIAAVAAAAGVDSADFEPEFRPARAGEIDRSCLDVSLVREKLGFTAQTTLRDGIARTYAWAREAAAV